jgi:hypothetical protein
VAQQFALRGEVARHPVDHDVAPDALVRLVAVERFVGAAERDHRAEIGWHFADHVVEIGRRAQQPQAAAARLPLVVEVDQHGNQLGRRVGVNATVLGGAAATHGDHLRPADEIDAELLREGARRLFALQLLDQPAEQRTVMRRLDGQQAGLLDLGKVVADRRRIGGADRVLHDGESERLARQRRELQRLEVEQRHGRSTPFVRSRLP